MGGHTLVGRLSGIWTQSGIVTASKCTTVYRHFGEAAVPEGKCGPCRLCIKIYTPVFALQLRKNHRKTSVGVAEKRLSSVGHDLFGWLGSHFMGDLYRPAGHHHLWHAPRVTWASPRSDICQVTKLRGPPNQLTLSQNSRLGIWCCQQTTELPSAHEFVYYWCTKVHQ